MYEELVDLYKRLDAYRQKRWRLAQYALIWLLFIPVSLALSRVVRFNAITFYLYVIFVALIICVVGLKLLANFIQNETEGRSLEQDVRDANLRAQLGVDDDNVSKRKREDPDVRYAVGEDGELVEVYDDKPLRNQ